MRTPILAITTLFLLAGASTGSGQRSQQCLHDQLETSANRARRSGSRPYTRTSRTRRTAHTASS